MIGALSVVLIVAAVVALGLCRYYADADQLGASALALAVAVAAVVGIVATTAHVRDGRSGECGPGTVRVVHDAGSKYERATCDVSQDGRADW